MGSAIGPEHSALMKKEGLFEVLTAGFVLLLLPPPPPPRPSSCSYMTFSFPGVPGSRWPIPSGPAGAGLETDLLTHLILLPS